jgi:hypothetical protein
VYVVNPDGTGDFPTIQAAVDGVGHGDYIELTDGVFRGPGNRDITGDLFWIRSQSGDPGSCIIDCEGTEADPHRGFHLFGVFGFIENITIRNGYVTGDGLDGSGGAILHRSSDLNVLGCVMIDCTAEHGGAVSVIGQTDGMDSGRYDGCVFAGNTARHGGAIALSEGARPHIDHSLLTGNLAIESGGAIDAGVDGLPEITHCTISGNRALADGGGLIAYHAYVAQSVLWSNCADGDGGDAMVLSGDVAFICSVLNSDGISGNPDYANAVFADPLFCDPVPCDDAPTTLGDYTVREDSPCLPENNICGQLIGALGQGCDVVPVRDATWGTIKKLFRY